MKDKDKYFEHISVQQKPECFSEWIYEINTIVYQTVSYFHMHIITKLKMN